MAARLVAGDPRLVLSRSWTTRAPRPGESASSYVFVDRPGFEARVAAGGFLEHAEFLGSLYGTPRPDPDPDHDLLLEIEVQGAEQVRAGFPDAVVVLLVPPSVEVQAERLRGRGDDEEAVARRLEKGKEEVAALLLICDHEVVNDDLERATLELAGILELHRSAAPSAPGGDPPGGL